MTYSVLIYPHPNLRLKSTPVDKVDAQTRQLIDAMFDIIYHNRGVGLSAPQINIQKRFFVVDSSSDQSNPLVFINPMILEKKENVNLTEGCLSFPGLYTTIKRANNVRVKALDRDGKEFTMDTTGLLAQCIQHEIDHLDGVLFIDYLSRLKRHLLLKKLNKFQKKP